MAELGCAALTLSTGKAGAARTAAAHIAETSIVVDRIVNGSLRMDGRGMRNE